MKTSKSDGRVIISKNGPYLVSADIPLSEQTILTDDDGGSERWSEAPPMQTRGDYALCRCGHSKAKPFCDGTHAKIGFDGSEPAYENNENAGEQRGGSNRNIHQAGAQPEILLHVWRDV
ncbi:MAG: CDGSH iron-sulfur domain-containing protein [Stellaceae bacterium]